jgi:hypothetical protein
LSEARSDRPAAVRREPPHARAKLLATDPEWLHRGLTMRLRHRGGMVDLFALSIMANALDRSPGTVRRLIALGVLPEARFWAPGRPPYGRKRLWTREEVLAVADLVDELGLHTRPRAWSDSPLPRLLAARATA